MRRLSILTLVASALALMLLVIVTTSSSVQTAVTSRDGQLLMAPVTTKVSPLWLVTAVTESNMPTIVVWTTRVPLKYPMLSQTGLVLNNHIFSGNCQSALRDDKLLDQALRL